MLCRILANISPNSINRLVSIMHTEIHCEVETESVCIAYIGPVKHAARRAYEVAHSREAGFQVWSATIFEFDRPDLGVLQVSYS